MIKEIFEPTEFMKSMGMDPMDFMRKQEIEASKHEDEDLADVGDHPEECPTCTYLDELRDYIRSQKENILKRGITHVIFHCAATQPHATVSAILKYWKSLGWINVGYNIILGVDFFTVLADFKTIVNGALGYNSKGLSFSYIGGINKNGNPKNTMTPFQKECFTVIAEELYAINPKLKFIGHNEVANKACPSYNVKDEFPDYWTGK